MLVTSIQHQNTRRRRCLFVSVLAADRRAERLQGHKQNGDHKSCCWRRGQTGERSDRQVRGQKGERIAQSILDRSITVTDEVMWLFLT